MTVKPQTYALSLASVMHDLLCLSKLVTLIPSVFRTSGISLSTKATMSSLVFVTYREGAYVKSPVEFASNTLYPTPAPSTIPQPHGVKPT